MTTGRPQRQLTRWQSEIARHLPHLHRAELTALALWSFAATLTEHIGQTTCAAFLAHALGADEDVLRQRLREFYRPAAIKRGADRRELDVRLCFGPLLVWALRLLRPRELVLALDPTLIRDRFAVLAVALVVHGCAIPVAWVVLEANTKGAWMPRWAPMLACLHAALPERTPVTVLADRGLASTALFAEICALGWHPMMRLTRQGSFRALGQRRWTPLDALPIRPGESLVVRGHLYVKRRHACTLLAIWRVGYAEPWLLMTDLSPRRCGRPLYGLRCWIEQGFRCLKSAGLRCERMRITDGARAERVWLVLAVSLLWTHALGADPEAGECTDAGEGLIAGVRRRLGAHRRGWVRLLGALARAVRLPLPRRVRWPGPPLLTLADFVRPPT